MVAPQQNRSSSARSMGSAAFSSSSHRSLSARSSTGRTGSGRFSDTQHQDDDEPPIITPEEQAAALEAQRRRLEHPPPDFMRSHSDRAREQLWSLTKQSSKQKLVKQNSQKKRKSRTARQLSSRTAATHRGDSRSSLVHYNDDDDDNFINEGEEGESSIAASRYPSTSHNGFSTGATGSIHLSGILSSNRSDDKSSFRKESQQEQQTTKKRCYSCSAFCSDLEYARDLCGAIVNDARVQLMIILLIVVNALMMGVATFDFISDNARASYAFETADMAFLIVFTVELFFQFVYHGLHLFLDGWLCFDFLIVVLSWSLTSFQIVRAFRIFRAIRLVTRVDVLRNLIIALFAVAPSMGAIIALLMLILYIYGVMCTILFKDLYITGVTEEDYFGRLDTTLFTLFQMITLEWSNIVRQVMQKDYYAWAIFTSFLVLTSFILYSLIIAVVCDAVKVTEHQDEMAEHVREKEESRQRLFALEHRVSDMAQQQKIILECLHAALMEVKDVQTAPGVLEEEEDGLDDVPSRSSDDGDEDDSQDEAIQGVAGPFAQRPARQESVRVDLGGMHLHNDDNDALDGDTNHAVVMRSNNDTDEAEDEMSHPDGGSRLDMMMAASNNLDTDGAVRQIEDDETCAVD